jgi:DNA end-binding protein Ku
VERRSLVKGYEFRKGKYLLLSDDDLDSVKVDSSSVMTIEKFVDTASIDPVYYDSAYYLLPDGEARKDVYAVLREAIANTGKTALSRVVIAQRERTIALRPTGDGLMAHTLYEDRDLNSSEELFAGVSGINSIRRWCNSPRSLWSGSPSNMNQPISRTATKRASGR